MERSAWPKNLSSSRKRQVKELLHGQNPTKKLRHLFDAHSQAGNNARPPSFADDLIVNVLSSFSNTLSESTSAESDEVLQVPNDACVLSEDSDGESISTPVPRTITSTELSACPENCASDRVCATEELLRGLKLAMELKDLLGARYQAGNNSRQPLLAEDLTVNLIGSYSDAISMLWKAECDEVLQVPTNACVGSEVSEESESINTPVPRKTLDIWTRLDQNLTDDGLQWSIYNQNSILVFESPRRTLDTQTRLDHNLIDDGYRWRKYGQKAILNWEYPRNYFRCAHKIDSGCQATKQVQKIKDDPPVYRTIHRGHHTCQESHPQIHLSFNTSLVAEQDDDDDNPIFFNLLSVYHEQKLPSEDDVKPHGHSNDDNSNDNNQPALSDSYADLESAGEI